MIVSDVKTATHTVIRYKLNKESSGGFIISATFSCFRKALALPQIIVCVWAGKIYSGNCSN